MKPVPVEPSRSTELPEKARLPKKPGPTRSTEGWPVTFPGCGIERKIESPAQLPWATELSKLSERTTPALAEAAKARDASAAPAARIRKLITLLHSTLYAATQARH